MKVLLFGGSGMVGQGVLRECLLDPSVETVLSVARRPLGRTSPKLQEIVRPDLSDLTDIEDRLRGFDAAFFPLGTSSVGKSEAEYRRVTFDLTLSVASRLARLDPGMTFVYVSGAGTDSTERGRSMWARVKGATENALLRLPFQAAYMFRPGVIRPLHGIRSKTAGYRVAYLMLRPFLWVARQLSPGSMTTTEAVGRAMIRVATVGAPSPILSTREINRLAASAPVPPG
ncbi:MAG: epimerase [Thermoplasmata archaeon]